MLATEITHHDSTGGGGRGGPGDMVFTTTFEPLPPPGKGDPGTMDTGHHIYIYSIIYIYIYFTDVFHGDNLFRPTSWKLFIRWGAPFFTALLGIDSDNNWPPKESLMIVHKVSIE